MFRKKGIDYLRIVEDIEVIKKQIQIVVSNLVEFITFLTLLFSFNLLSRQGEIVDFDSIKQSFLNANYIFFIGFLIYRFLNISLHWYYWYENKRSLFIGNILGVCLGGILFIKSIDEILQFRIEPFIAFYFKAFFILLFCKFFASIIKICIEEVYERRENKLV